MSSVKGNDSLRDTVTLTPKILERMFYNHMLRIKGRKKKRKQEEKEEKRKKKTKERGTRRRRKRRWLHYKCA